MIFQSEPPLKRAIEPAEVIINIGGVAYEIGRSERRDFKVVTAGKPKSSKAADEIFGSASCLVNAGLLIEREGLIRSASRPFANGRGSRQKVMLLRDGAIGLLDAGRLNESVLRQRGSHFAEGLKLGGSSGGINARESRLLSFAGLIVGGGDD